MITDDQSTWDTFVLKINLSICGSKIDLNVILLDNIYVMG